MKLTHIIAAASSLLMLPVFSTAQTVIWQLNEDFSEAADTSGAVVRPTPGPTTWFFQTATISAFNDTANTMTLGMNANNNATRTHVAYFSNGTGAYSSTAMPTMSVGDTVTLSFTCTINDDQTAGILNQNDELRWGLLNARGNQVIGNYSNGTLGLSTGNQYTGYAATMNLNPSGTGSAVSLRQRLTTAAAYTLFDSTGTTLYTTLGSGGDNTVSYTADGLTSYTFNLELSLLTSTSMEVSYSSSLDPTGVTFTQDITGLSDLLDYDTFGLETKNNGGISSYTLSNLSITMTQVPEPATYAVLAGLAVLGFAYIRRRRS